VSILNSPLIHKDVDFSKLFSVDNLSLAAFKLSQKLAAVTSFKQENFKQENQKPWTTFNPGFAS